MGEWSEYFEDFPVCEVSPVNSVSDLNCPIFLIHGDEDKRIGSHHSRQIFENANEPKQLWICEGVGHLGTYLKYTQLYQERVLNFFNKYLS